MWGDLLSSSQLTDEEFKRLASDLESGLFTFEQVRAARSEAEIGRYLDAARYGNDIFLQNCSGQKNAEVFNQLHYEMDKSNFNPCDGCSKLTSLYANDTIAEQICEDHTCPIWIENHPERKIGLVLLSITTIAKNRVARCGAACGGEKTLMVTFELVPDQNKRCDESVVSPVVYFNRSAEQEDKNG